MEFLMTADYRATDKEIVLWWDKPEWAKKGATYELHLTKAGEEDREMENRQVKVSCSHYTFQDLTPASEYEIRIRFLPEDADEAAEEKPLYILTCRTGREKRRLDVTKEPYLALGDGKTLNTDRLQRALNDCKADEIVYVAAGTYLSGALDLHSDMELYLEKGAVLQGTEAPEDYLPMIHSRFEGYERECYRSLLNLGILDRNAGYNCKNVVIRGEGGICGGGMALARNCAEEEKKRVQAYLDSLGDDIKEFEKPETVAFRCRGRLINMSNCSNIWIHGLNLGYGASWNLHFIYSEQIVTDHCRFYSAGVWNGDGWDPDSSTDSTLFDCEFYTEDDSVAIKSGKNPEGNKIGRPTKGIRVFDSITHYGHGLCMGSEMSGGIEDIRLWDCEMGPTWSGIEIKATKKRGGYVRNVWVRDCTASHIMLHSVGYNDDGIGAPVPPVFENCSFERVYLLGRFLDNPGGAMEWHDCPAIEVRGFDVPGYEARNIRFSGITMEQPADEKQGSILMNFAKNVSMEKMKSVKRNREYTVHRVSFPVE